MILSRKDREPVLSKRTKRYDEVDRVPFFVVWFSCYDFVAMGDRIVGVRTELRPLSVSSIRDSANSKRPSFGNLAILVPEAYCTLFVPTRNVPE